jgi:amino acid transporter
VDERLDVRHHTCASPRELRSFGYEQQLSRSMGVFSSLSISISCMCITAGIFTVYAYALSTAGPAFVWTWPVVAAGQILVALVLAELAGRLALSGYAFHGAGGRASGPGGRPRRPDDRLPKAVIRP